MKLLLSTMLLLCLLFSAQAQNPLVEGSEAAGFKKFPDSIRVEFQDQHGLIIFKLKNFRSDPQQLKTFLKTLQQAVETTSKSLDVNAGPQAINITTNDEGVLTITISSQATKTTRILATEKETTELLPPGWEINLNTKNGHVYVYAQTFEELRNITAMDPEPIREKIASTEDKVYVGRKRIEQRVIINKGAAVYNEVKYRMPLDELNINGSAGFGYVNKMFYPELNLQFAFVFSNRFNRQTTQLSLYWNNLFFTKQNPDGRISNQTNSFLSLAYSHKFGNQKEHTWATLGAGYLIHKKGDYFTGKTMKFFFGTSVGKFTIMPEFYLTNDFKNYSTGLKVLYTF